MLTSSDQDLINRLFKRLQAIFPKWREIWHSDEEVKAAKREWVRLLIHRRVSSSDMVKMGLRKASTMGWVRPPSAGQFADWCIESAREAAGIPSLEEARRAIMAKLNGGELPKEGPIYQVKLYLDWWEVSHSDYDKITRRIEQAYQRMIDHWMSGIPWDKPPVSIEDSSSKPRGKLTPELKAKGSATFAKLRSSKARPAQSLKAPQEESKCS